MAKVKNLEDFNGKIDLEFSKIYDVQIGGYSLKLKTSNHPAHVKKLVQIVENKIGESLKTHSSISIQKALILSCLNIAEDYINLKNGVHSQLDQIESKAQSLSNLLKSSGGNLRK